MKERGILFSAPMVRALLAGTKTQTRRVVKVQPHASHNPQHAETRGAGWVWMAHDDRPTYSFATGDFRCPYGQPGDRLWVRESWMPDPPIDDTWASTEWAGCREGKIAGVPERFRHPRFCNYAADWLHGKVIWTPSIHMPRWASRITLEVTGVRVERLQDISEADAEAEGIESVGTARTWWRNYTYPCGFNGDPTQVVGYRRPTQSYRSLWESINGPGSWDANPWVWVVEFKRIEVA